MRQSGSAERRDFFAPDPTGRREKEVFLSAVIVFPYTAMKVIDFYSRKEKL